MRFLETGLFVSMAVAVHLGAAALTTNDGEQSSGAGGEASLTLIGATSSIAAMVEDWERPPETEQTVDQPEPVQDSAPPNEVANLQPLPDQSQPEAVIPPTDQMRVPQTLPDALPLPVPPSAQENPELPVSISAAQERPVEPPKKTDKPKQTASATLTPPSALNPAPRIDTSPVSKALRQASRPRARPQKPIQKPQEKPKPKTAQTAPQNSTASAAQPTTRAKGTGGGSKSGQSGKSASSTAKKGNSASLMAKWKSQVQRATQRKLVYPRKAQKRRITGRVLVRIRISGTGQLISSSIAKSSGNPILDQSALKTITRVGRFPAAPKGLTQGNQDFRIPVSFRLK